MTAPAASAALVLSHLRCEYRVNPIGLDEPRPRLSWKLAAAGNAKTKRGLRQSAYQIRVARSRESFDGGRADLWDSGRVESGDSVFVEYAGTPLKPGERAWWSVRVWDQDGAASDVSPVAFWEAGLPTAKDWSAKWIGSTLVGSRKNEGPVPYFRKEFSLPAGKSIQSARLYATALGVYEFHLNGQRVGDEMFAPFWTDYDKRVQYQAYDVTALLKSGGNAAGAMLGDGWYCGFTGNIRLRQFYGDRPQLLAELLVTFDDGTVQRIVTDESWRTSTGALQTSDMLMGEAYDARLEERGWSEANFAAGANWTPVTLPPAPPIEIVAMSGPPVRAVKEITPIAPPKNAGGWPSTAHIFDLGQNMVGTVRVRVKGPAGHTVSLRFAEVLDDKGKLYTINLRSARQTDHYTLRGDEDGEVYEPHFTFHGFRYVEVTGLLGEVDESAVTGIVLHSDMEQTGHFECSDPLVNQLARNIEWGQRGNFLDVPTDCPQRDERLGWTGDAQAFVRTASYNFDVSGFFAKWTQTLRDNQGPRGEFPSVAPNNVRTPPEKRDNLVDGGPAWADAGVICPWQMYQSYGDRRLIEQHFDSMARFVRGMVAEAESFNGIRSHPDSKGFHGYGDWLSQDGKDGLFGNTPKDLIGTAFLAYDAGLLAGLARSLGKTKDAATFDKIRSDTIAAFRRRYVTEGGLIAGNTQTAYVLALHFDLLTPEHRKTAIAELVRKVRENGNRLNTGFVGTPYLQHVLTDAGQLELAYDLLMQKNWPSWLYAVTHGATTIWERWDGWTHDKGFADPGMNSFNHYAYGAVGDWLFGTVAGIQADNAQPGFKHIVLKPRPLAGGPLSSAKATLETPYGRVESGWTVDGDKLTYRVTVPVNATATLHLPGQSARGDNAAGRADGDVTVFEIGSGEYTFESTLAASK